MAWLAAIGYAEPITFTAESDGATQVATVDVQSVDGIEYVPLLEIVEDFGGSYDLLFRRVQVDMGGRRTYVPFNERRIQGSTSQFDLARPVIRPDGNILIAREDVATFFGRAFEVLVEDQKGPTASIPIAGEAPAVPPVIEESPAIIPVAVPKVARKVKTVIIDPGHGGRDHGVTGRGVEESELALEIAKSLRDALAKAGFAVVLTREESVDRTLAERAKLANDRGGDLLIALHTGSSFAPNAHGIEVFYPILGPGEVRSADRANTASAALAHPYTDRSQRFAQILADALRDAASAEIRGIHGARLRLHRTAEMPGALLEMGVLTNAADEALLEKDSYRQSIVQGVVAAVQQLNDETGTS